MASSTFHVLLLITLLFILSQTGHARDSHFFSKVTPLTNNNADKQSKLPNIEPQLETEPAEASVKPTFIPEMQNNYGLYGQDQAVQQTQLPPANFNDDEKLTSGSGYRFTSNNKKLTTAGDDGFTSYNNRLTAAGDDSFTFNNKKLTAGGDDGFTYDNKKLTAAGDDDGFTYNAKDFINTNNVAGKLDMDPKETGYGSRFSETNSEAKFTEPFKYNDLRSDRNYYGHVASKFGDGERQGMSDTRFLEGGKYYYDVNSESKYNYNFDPAAMYGNSRHVGRRNRYRGTGQGYFGKNNQNMYENNMSMYQNLGEEFTDEQEDQFQP